MLAHMLGSVSACDRHYQVECRWLAKQRRKGDDKPCVQMAPGAGGRFHGNGNEASMLAARDVRASLCPCCGCLFGFGFQASPERMSNDRTPVSSLPHPSASLPLASP